MNCPHCQKELPENYGAQWCPLCGKDLPASATYAVPQPPPSSDTLRPFKINWFIFFAILLAPALLTTLTASTNGGRNEQVSPAIALFGGGAAGFICGVLLALRLGNTVLTRFILGLVFACIMACVCIMLCFAGCMIGGYQFRMN